MFGPPIDVYPFPVGRNALPRHSDLPAFFDATINKPIEELTLWFAQSLDAVRSPVVARLRDIVLQYRPEALVYTNGEWLLKIANSDFCNTNLYLLAPPSSNDLRMTFERFNIKSEEALLDFFRFFHGFRFEDPFIGQGFWSLSRWEPFKDHGWNDMAHASSKQLEWLESVPIYADGAGASILLNSSGQLAWSVLPLAVEDRIRIFEPSFDSFLSKFVDILERDFALVYDYKSM
ncbi:hypothetical protein [Singulisphaera sp. PoT]|uniref:hypothetical protein n=1 Tax=Singulisphaera sp. PoT TaxID=3411797 RepID=UPI003BF4B0D6